MCSRSCPLCVRSSRSASPSDARRFGAPTECLRIIEPCLQEGIQAARVLGLGEELRADLILLGVVDVGSATELAQVHVGVVPVLGREDVVTLRLG